MTKASRQRSLRQAEQARMKAGVPASSRETQLPNIARYVTFEISRRIYRWSRSNLRLQERLRQLKLELRELPRPGVGILLEELDPELDARIAPLRQANRELVIGDFDQDGGLLPRFGEIRGIPSISADQFLPRSGCPVLLVDLNGRLGVRKIFRKSLGRFIQEIEAMLQLESFDCPVPRLMNVDWDARAITMTYVEGDVVRELLALAGADIRDRDSRSAYTRSIDKERIEKGRSVLPKVLSESHIAKVAAGLQTIHSAGFVLEDVKFGNIILERKTGEPIFVDLERALPIASLPAPIANHLREIDLRKFREHFGDAQVAEPARQ
jgi:hypothetical protein